MCPDIRSMEGCRSNRHAGNISNREGIGNVELLSAIDRAPLVQGIGLMGQEVAVPLRLQAVHETEVTEEHTGGRTPGFSGRASGLSAYRHGLSGTGTSFDGHAPRSR